MGLEIGSSGDAVRDLQARMMFLGFHPGPIDGVFDPVLEQAVEEYQASIHDSVSGMIDETALQILRDSTETQGFDADLAFGGAYDNNYALRRQALDDDDHDDDDHDDDHDW